MPTLPCLTMCGSIKRDPSFNQNRAREAQISRDIGHRDTWIQGHINVKFYFSYSLLSLAFDYHHVVKPIY